MADASPTVIPAAGVAAEQRHKLTVKVASGRDLPRMNDTSYPNPYVCISAFEEQEMNQIQIGRLDHKVKNIFHVIRSCRRWTPIRFPVWSTYVAVLTAFVVGLQVVKREILGLKTRVGRVAPQKRTEHVTNKIHPTFGADLSFSGTNLHPKTGACFTKWNQGGSDPP